MIGRSEIARNAGVLKNTLMTWMSDRTPDLIQLDKVEVHTGPYKISIKKVIKK